MQLLGVDLCPQQCTRIVNVGHGVGEQLSYSCLPLAADLLPPKPHFEFFAMPDEFTVEARGRARTSAFLDENEFDKKFDAGIAHWRLTRAHEQFMHAVRHARVLRGRPAASNKYVRRAAQFAAIDIALELQEELDGSPCYLATFCWDEGLTWEDRPYASYVPMQLRVYRALKALRLVGIIVIEFDTLRPLDDGPRQRQFHHAHCIVWKREGKFHPKKSAKDLMAGPSFPNCLGAPSVQFKRITDLPSHFARTAAYMFKLRAHAKNRVPRKKGGYRLRKTEKGFTSGTAVRTIETLSHVSIFDLVRGIGPEGAALVRRWKRKTCANMADFRRGPSASSLSVVEDVTRTWREVRHANANHGSRKFRDCVIVTNSNARNERHRPKTSNDIAYLRRIDPK